MQAIGEEGTDGGRIARTVSHLRLTTVRVQQKFATSTCCQSSATVCRLIAWILNFCGLFIFFVSLCALEAKINSPSTGLLWWAFMFHGTVSAMWLAHIFGVEISNLVDIQPLRCISAMLMMLAGDRAIQLKV